MQSERPQWMEWMEIIQPCTGGGLTLEERRTM